MTSSSSSSSNRPATAAGNIRKGGAAEDTASLGSFHSDTNNNPSVYQNLPSAMAGTKLSHYPVNDDDGDDFEDTENNNNNYRPPPPLRPKSSASQHAPEKSWYETSLDKVVVVVPLPGGKLAKTAHKPPALLPREMNLLQAPQLHIDIPTSPIHPQQLNHHQQLERSLSHRMAASNFASSSLAAVSPPPPIMRQHQQQQQREDVELNSPVGAHKKLSASNSYHGGNNNGGGVTTTTMASGSNNAANNVNNNNNLSAPRRTQSNVLQQQQQQQSPSTTTAALLSPRLVNGQVAGTTEDAIQVESPKNMTVVQQGKFQPYKEESKPFEMSDFYKYSTKFRQQGSGSGGNGNGGNINGKTGSSRNNVDENLYRGNVLYREEQRGYSELADVANNNISRGNSNNHHNNTNAPHILKPNSGSNSTVYGQSGASNATASAGGGQQYPISYQQ